MKPLLSYQHRQRELNGSSCWISLYLYTNISIYCGLYIHVLIALVLSHLVIRPWCFWKIKEKKYKINLNNDLAVVTSHIPVEVVHDRAHTEGGTFIDNHMR